MRISNPFILGLLIGDGSFQINHWKKKYLQYRIVCKLKETEYNFLMLSNLKDTLNFGKVKLQNGMVLWVVDNKKDITNYIKHLFDSNLIDYVFVPRIKLKLYKLNYCINTNLSYDEYYYMENNNNLWKNKLNSEAYIIKDYKILNYSITSQILCGLIEAEGCFSIRKNGNLSFSISQQEGLEFIQIIKELFLLPNIIRTIKQLKNGSKTPKDVHLIETYNKLSLIRIMEFLETGNSVNIKFPQDLNWSGLKGEKLISFLVFKNYFLQKFKNTTTKV